ncbi:MAG: hypothetical protein EKK64_06915 [Neisseriaceae bacterium]|nr:MAG: hypothetical protein EKK64_06915 [Neisseriaceae bacterium]
MDCLSALEKRRLTMKTSQKIDYKNLVQSLSDETITKKDYDKALQLISDRVQEIWHYVCKVSKRKLYWWAFSNDEELGNGNGSTGGFFDPKEDSEFIRIFGEVEYIQNQYFELTSGFPTELLWDENYKKKVDEFWQKAQEEFKKEKQDKKEEYKLKKQNLELIKDSIKEKIKLYNFKPKEIKLIESLLKKK